MNYAWKTLLVWSLLAMSISTGFAADREFAGINFGVGISVTKDIGDRDRIEGASLDENGLVRVDKESNDIARVMLESHYFFIPKKKTFLGLTPAGQWGHGPFIALQPGTDEIIEAIGIGWMVGFRKSDIGSDSWNIGFGYIVDPSVRMLGDGLKENSALPAGETQIRYKEKSQSGVFLLASFSF
ncbi:MAG: hypothetical protein KZQ96_22315 [Candidatus Thiodiazotropha sp. (ex Lucinoma borealis)]|nr:hypothetical protein [Candidatus Thiodiazotropha sp. (ex Lucinoma borealis)]MCU7868243.1 hypothetical protein [Candidatus Thiodiazotropha sp. (ex Lucinoma borealis)]